MHKWPTLKRIDLCCIRPACTAWLLSLQIAKPFSYHNKGLDKRLGLVPQTNMALEAACVIMIITKCNLLVLKMKPNKWCTRKPRPWLEAFTNFQHDPPNLALPSPGVRRTSLSVSMKSKEVIRLHIRRLEQLVGSLLHGPMSLKQVVREVKDTKNHGQLQVLRAIGGAAVITMPWSDLFIQHYCSESTGKEKNDIDLFL